MRLPQKRSLAWLVIGGTGLVGRYLVHRLTMEGHEVSVVTRYPQRVPIPAQPILCDIGQNGWTKSIDPSAYDYVVHMAYATTGNVDYDRAVTVTSVAETVQHFSQSLLKHFILLGSMSVFGMDLPAGVLDEQMPRVPDCEYAKNKIDAANVAMGAHSQFPISVLHPTGVYAEASKRLNMYSEILSQGYIVFQAGGLGVNNIVHADDVATAIIAVSNRKLGNRMEEYIINGETITFAEWLAAQERWLGVDELRRLPKIIAPICLRPIRRILGNLGLRAPIRLPAYKAALFERKAVLSSDKARSHFAWRAQHRFANLINSKRNI